MKEVNVKILNDYAGHDGMFYFCRRCGKAGFQSIMQVRGHLSACPSRSEMVVVAPIPAPVKEVKRADGGAESDVIQNLWVMVNNISQRLEKAERVLFNELPHQLASNKAGNDRWLWGVAIIVLAIGFLQHFGGQDTVGKLVSKASDRALSKGVDKLFGLL